MSAAMTAQPQAITIEVGEHIEWHVFGVTLNGDTITSTLIAGAILIGLGLWVRHKASVGQPSGLAYQVSNTRPQLGTACGWQSGRQ